MSFHKKLGSFLLGLAVAVGSVVLGQVPISGLPPANLPLTGSEQVVMTQIQNGRKITVQAPSVLVGPATPYSAAIGGTGEAGTITGVPMANGTSPFTQATGAQIAAPFTGCSPTNPLLSWLGTCQLNTANPTGTIGLSAVNGVATTYMQSDAAPALSQAISPTWTATHTFSNTVNLNGTVNVNQQAANTGANIFLVGGPSGGTINRIRYNSNSIANNSFALRDDASAVDRMAIASDGGMTVGALSSQGSGTVNMVGCFVSGVACLTNNSFANPATQIGLSTVNGVATTAMRSDAAPALSQAIAPTWTGTHRFNATYATSTGSTSVSPGQQGITFINSTSGVDAKIWDILQTNANHISFRAVNDAFASASPWLDVARSGLTISSLAFGNATDNPGYNFLGTGQLLVGSSTYGGATTPKVGLVSTGGTGNYMGSFDGTHEAIMGTYTSGGFVGSFSNHVFDIRTNNIARFSVASSGLATGLFGVSAQSARPTISTSTSQVTMGADTGGVAQLLWVNSGAAVDSKTWDCFNSTTDFQCRVINDANNLANSWLDVNRTGTTINSVAFPSQGITFANPGSESILVSTAGISTGPVIAKVRNTNSAGYSSFRLWNDIGSGARAVEMDYSGSAYASNLLTSGPTGESGALATTGAFPLCIGTANTCVLEIDGSKNITAPGAASVPWSGGLLKSTSGGLNASTITVGGTAWAGKTSPTNRNTTTTPSNDADVTITNLPTGTYSINAFLVFLCADTTMGAKFNLNTTATTTSANNYGATIAYSIGAGTVSATPNAVSTTVTGSVTSLTTASCGASANTVQINGILTTTSSGSLSVSWAQTASDASNLSFGASSYLQLLRIN